MKQHYYHIMTFGCQMNKSDSERMAAVLDKIGLKCTKKPEEADIILLNSCSVRESAEARIFGFTRNFAKFRKDKPDLIIGVTGCMPGRDKDKKVGKELKEADLYFPIRDIIKLPEWLLKMRPHWFDKKNLDLKNKNKEFHYLTLDPDYTDSYKAYVPIQTGCNQFCTYCVVPYARGKEINRPVKEILCEIKNLADRGCLEITLLGQIVNNYRAPHSGNFSKDNPYKKNDFAKLLWEVNQIDGIERIHFTGPHPAYVDDEFIDALTLPKQINFLHLPVQSGSDKILEKMNRKHGRDFYIDIIKKIRKKRPEMAIGTDIIVGFCGETEKDFQDTVDLYKQCDFDISYNAKYSNRSGTVASKVFEDNISGEEKKRRWFALHKIMEEITLRKNQEYVDKVVSVLVDKYKDGVCTGNSNEMKLTRFKSDKDLVGKIVDVKIISASVWILEGAVV